ncbi:class I SAM-dependent methyltransferase [Rossellomorea aquimaris]|uniref:class I SAM-dependent methyltransferase n=1 Tax=Rossellomorea aquimaris TaxID=189382 RepID=UPI0007D0590C|nr:class I SAM-dependent methyltransferase [Rossellomorea aquimaris]
MDTTKHNSQAWDKKVEDGAIYTKPVNKEMTERAKNGKWNISVTTDKAVPRNWFPVSIEGLKILCLASGGGQQGPILAAAGADVTVVDISEQQLIQDQMVAKRDNLCLKTIQGSMTDLHFFEDASFDLIINPVSNVFVENVLPVWKEAYRVLKQGGILIAGFTNPILYLFDDEQEDKGILEVKHSIPYSPYKSLTEEEIQKCVYNNQTFEFGHTLEDQIQGQIEAGFVIGGFYESDFAGSRLVDQYFKSFITTKAIKL